MSNYGSYYAQFSAHGDDDFTADNNANTLVQADDAHTNAAVTATDGTAVHNIGLNSGVVGAGGSNINTGPTNVGGIITQAGNPAVPGVISNISTVLGNLFGSKNAAIRPGTAVKTSYAWLWWTLGIIAIGGTSVLVWMKLKKGKKATT